MGRPRKNAVVEGGAADLTDSLEDAPNPFEDAPDSPEVIVPPALDSVEAIVPEDVLSPPTVEAPPVAELPPVVKVKCIAKNNPWTDVKPLEYGEEAEVSREIAEIMASKHQVVIV